MFSVTDGGVGKHVLQFFFVEYGQVRFYLFVVKEFEGCVSATKEIGEGLFEEWRV